MSEVSSEDALSEARPLDTTVVQIGKTRGGEFTATQQGLDVIGTGPSAARATEDMARQIAEEQERGDL